MDEAHVGVTDAIGPDGSSGVMRMRTRPWSGAIPDEDIRAFPAGPSAHERDIVIGDRVALVVVDMTRAFVEGGYPTSCVAMGPTAVRHARRLIDAAREANIPVFFTKSCPKGSPLPDALRHRWRYYSPDVRKGSLATGDEIVDQLMPQDGDTIIYKYSNPSGFFGTPLGPALLQLKTDTVVVIGATTSGCVRATVVDAFSFGLQVVVAYDACADRSGISHKVNLFDMHMKYADVAASDEVIEWLRTVHDPSEHAPSQG